MIDMDEHKLAWTLHDLGEMYESFDTIRYATRCLDELVSYLDDEESVEEVKRIRYLIQSSTNFCMRTLSKVLEELHPEGVGNLADYLFDESDEDPFDIDEDEVYEEEDDEEFEEDDEVEDK